MRENQMPNWLNELISSEASQIVKTAQSTDKMKELEEKIDNAQTPEELDEIEKELATLESEPNEEFDTSKKDQFKEKSSGDDSNESEADDDSQNSDSDDEENFESNIDLSDILKEVKEVKDDVSDEKENIQRKLLNQLEHLNDQLGLNKIVDLNSTIDSGM